MGKQILILISLVLWGCAHKPAGREPAASAPAVNLYVYRIEIGFKSKPMPVAELFMPHTEFRRFVSTMDFRDREFRRNTFYNGCYLFRHAEAPEGRSVAALAHGPIYCYSSAHDRFLPKSPLVP